MIAIAEVGVSNTVPEERFTGSSKSFRNGQSKLVCFIHLLLMFILSSFIVKGLVFYSLMPLDYILFFSLKSNYLQERLWVCWLGGQGRRERETVF